MGFGGERAGSSQPNDPLDKPAGFAEPATLCRGGVAKLVGNKASRQALSVIRLRAPLTLSTSRRGTTINRLGPATP